MSALRALVAITIALLVFGAFGWLGFALAVVVVSIWWLTDEDGDGLP